MTESPVMLAYFIDNSQIIGTDELQLLNLFGARHLKPTKACLEVTVVRWENVSMDEPDIDRPEKRFGIGDLEACDSFAKEYRDFLDEYVNLQPILQRVFDRSIAPPSELVKAVDELPEGDAQLKALRMNWLADELVFSLGRMATEEFGDLFLLAANGSGFGAFKMLRSIYERVVTAAYVSKFPAEAIVFAEHEAIERWKILKELLATDPDGVKTICDDRELTKWEQGAKDARAKEKLNFCSKCRQPITQEAWTRVTIRDMASKSIPSLLIIYPNAYLAPTFHLHATAFGTSARMRHTESGFVFRDESRDEILAAIHGGHNLILRLLELQNTYFSLELESEIQSHFEAFVSIWSRRKKAQC